MCRLPGQHTLGKSVRSPEGEGTLAAAPSRGRASGIDPRPLAAPEADATRSLYERYSRQISNYCLHQLSSREEAEARLRSLVPHGDLQILSNSPAAPLALTNPLAARLLELVPEVAPKQAWTPVAQFAEQGIDAINYGPGETAYAHRADEQVPIANLERCYETLRDFLS